MTGIRNVYKNQIVSEDIALGIGTIEQIRRGVTIQGTRLPLPAQVANLAALALLDPVVSNLALVPEADNVFTIYMYKPDVTTGAPALPGLPGTWVPQQGSSNTIVSETAPPFPTSGLVWIRCTDMKSFVWYIDGDSAQWVEDNPSRGGTPLNHNDQLNRNAVGAHDAIYSRSFKTVADLKNGIDASGQTINMSQIVGSRVEWRGYYAESDGGSNWGIVKSGAHTDDGFKIFSISATLYVEANLKGESVNPRKAGAKGDNATDDLAPINKAIAYAESSGIRKLKWSEGIYRTSDTLVINHKTHWFSSGECTIRPLVSLTNKPVVTNTQVINGLWSGYFSIKDITIENVESVFNTQAILLKGAVWEWELNNVQVKGFGLAGTKFDRCYRGRVINCGWYSCGLGGSEQSILIMSSDPADRSSNIRISGGNIQDAPANTYAVRIDGAVGCTLDMLTFQSNGRGVTFAGTTNCIIRDCYMEDLDREINLVVGTNGKRNQSLTISNCLMIRNTYALPFLLEGDEDTLIENCRGVGSNVLYISRNSGSRRSRVKNCKGIHYSGTKASFNDITVVRDNFYGAALNTNTWRIVGTGSAAIVSAGGGRCRLSTLAVNGSGASIYTGIAPLLYADENPVVECTAQLNTITNVFYRPIDLVQGTSYIRVYANNAGGGTNFVLECSNSGATTSVAMALVCDTASHNFRLEIMPDKVSCLIDGKDLVEIITNIPTTALECGSTVIATEAAIKTVDITSFVAEKDFTRV